MTLLETQQAHPESLLTPPVEKPSFFRTMATSAVRTAVEPVILPQLAEDKLFPTPERDKRIRTLLDSFEPLPNSFTGASSTAQYVGDFIGMAVSPFNWLSDGAGGIAAHAATEGLLGGAEKFLLHREVSASVKKQLLTYATAGGTGAAAFLPQSVVENYDLNQHRIHWGGVAENAGLGALGGLFLPAVPFAFRLLKRLKANDVPLTPEEASFETDYEKNIAKPETQTEDVSLEAVLARDEQAQAIIQKYKPNLELDNGKVPLHFMDHDDTVNLQAAIAHALATKTEAGLDTRLAKAIIDGHVERVLSDEDMVNGLDEFRRYQSKVVQDRRALAKQHQAALFSRLNKLRPHSRKLELSQQSLYRKLQDGDITIQDIQTHLQDVPKAVEEKLKDDAVNLLSPREELQKITSRLFDDKGNPHHDFFKSRYFRRLQDLAREWQAAKALLQHAGYRYETERQTQFLRLADYFLKTASEIQPLGARLQSVRDSLQAASRVKREPTIDVHSEKPTHTIESIEDQLPFERTRDNREAYDLATSALAKAKALKNNREAFDARHGERSEGAYSAVGSDFLPSVSDCKKSLRAVKSFESPCVVEP